VRSEVRTSRPAVADPSVHIGPALYELSPDDDEGVRELFAEQRARIEVVRRNGIWGFMGGIRGEELRWIYAQIASLPAMVLLLLVAGFTRGPVLWGCAALAFALFVAGWIGRFRNRRRWISIYRRGVLRPAVVVAFDPKLPADPVTPRWMHVLVGLDVEEAKGLRRLIETGDRLRGMIEHGIDVPGPLAAFVEQARKACLDRVSDGSRIVPPDALNGGRAELARLGVDPETLPGGRFASRLFFAFVDEADRGGESVLQVPSEAIWGACIQDVCRRFPLETPR
jgi:hypothetical protein